MASDISKVFHLEGSRVIFTHVIECKRLGNNETATAVVLVFDNGHTEVRCPAKQGDCSCSYGARDRPMHAEAIGIKQKIENLVMRIVIIAFVLFPLVLAGISEFKKP